MDEIFGIFTAVIVTILLILTIVTQVFVMDMSQILNGMTKNCITIEGKVYCEQK